MQKRKTEKDIEYLQEIFHTSITCLAKSKQLPVMWEGIGNVAAQSKDVASRERLVLLFYLRTLT